MDTMLRGLNAAQKAAVTSRASVLQCLAPPGKFCHTSNALNEFVSCQRATDHCRLWQDENFDISSRMAGQ